MAQKEIARAAHVIVEPSGVAKLVDAPLEESELRILRHLIERSGYQPIADMEGFEHIRVNDPDDHGYNRDYAVLWKST